jgi:hypothetical protein
MKPIELGKLLQQNPPLGCQAEGAWERVAEMCGPPPRAPQPPASSGDDKAGGKR